MFELVFLLVLGFIAILFATVQDIRKREIANWLNFGLVIFALGFRFFYSLFEMNNFNFFYQGLIGFGIFLVLGNLFYYSRMFAGGDAKLFISLGAILPVYDLFFLNVESFIAFILIFLIVGAIYGLVISIYFSIANFSNFKKSFRKTFIKNRKLFFSGLFLSSLFFVWAFFLNVLFWIGVLILAFPLIYLFSKSVDDSCMIRKIKSSKLTEGDWLYKDIKIGSKTIKASWEGLSMKEILLIQKKKKFVFVRYGIQFAPVFLISYLLWIAWFIWF